MPFLTINGVTLKNVSIEEGPENIGEVGGRGIIGNVLRTRTAKLRSWRVATPIMTNAEARAVRGLLEGNGQSWRFSEIGSDGSSYDTVLSGLGVTASVSGAFTPALTGGRSGGPRLTVTSGSRFGVRMAQRVGVLRRGGWTPADGYTLMMWRSFDAGTEGISGFNHVVVKGAVDFAATANPVGLKQFVNGISGSYSLGNALGVSASSPYVALHGKRITAANGDVDFSDVVFLPFEVPDDFVAQLYAFAQTSLYARLPRALAHGSFIDDASPIEVVCEVRSIPQHMGNVDGAGTVPTNRSLEIEMLETV
jgi:hypothetical protein